MLEAIDLQEGFARVERDSGATNSFAPDGALQVALWKCTRHYIPADACQRRFVPPSSIR
jgi:hypothetical protein